MKPKVYEIDYGSGTAILETPFKDWKSRFYVLADTCFGIRKSITQVAPKATHEWKRDERLHPYEFESLSFMGNVYIWRRDGARMCIEPFWAADGEWDTQWCDKCKAPDNMELVSMEVKVYNSDYGHLFCGHCGARLRPDRYGYLPEECPECDCWLNYNDLIFDEDDEGECI